MKTKQIMGYNNFPISTYLWDKVDSPIGIVQIIHGMKEHGKRYTDFAKYLNKQGYIVLASDLRGHGQTAINNNLPLGYSDGDIFPEIVQDQIIITDYLAKTYNLPISIFGHSFGSMIAQRYMVENGFKIKNIILCGSTYTNSFQFKAGYIASSISRFFRGKKKHAKLVEKIGIDSYGKNFIGGNWLSRDEKVWTQYNEDELCGKPFPNNFYWSFFKNARHNYKNLKNIPYYLPILIISGTNDPVAGKNGIVKLFFTYGRARKRVYFKSYMNSRHELLNETNKEEVYKDVVQFISTDTLDHIKVIRE